MEVAICKCGIAQSDCEYHKPVTKTHEFTYTSMHVRLPPPAPPLRYPTYSKRITVPECPICKKNGKLGDDYTCVSWKKKVETEE